MVTPTQVLGLPQSIEIDKSPDKKFWQVFTRAPAKTSSRFSCFLPKVGAGWFLIWAESKGMSRGVVAMVMPSNHLILSPPSPPASVFRSIRVFSNESALCLRWSKYWSFNISICPFSEYSGLISFRVDWLDV